MSASREIEKLSVEACPWKTGHAVLQQLLCLEDNQQQQQKQQQQHQPWKLLPEAQAESLACTFLPEGVHLRLAPQGFNWKRNVHFHDQFKVPAVVVDADADADAADTNNGTLLFTFEAKARESLVVALSPTDTPEFVRGRTIEIQLGAVGNTALIIQRRQQQQQQPKGQGNQQDEHVSISIPCRVCHDKAWISYWICLHKGKVSVGIGNRPGEQCIGVLDDSEFFEKQQGEEELSQEEEGDKLKPKPKQQSIFVGLNNSARPGPQSNPLYIQNVVLTRDIPSTVLDKLAALPPAVDDLPAVVLEREDENWQETKKAMEDYKAECRLRKQRADKFGGQYKQQKGGVGAFLPWSQAKRLRENPSQGFVTGIDMMAQEQVEKRKARLARFGGHTEADAAAAATTTTTVVVEMETGGVAKDTMAALPIVEAWDKEELLRKLRTDPAESLWIIQPPPEESLSSAKNNFCLEPPKPATWVHEKIHLCAIDWAAFKQIRNNDIMVSRTWRSVHVLNGRIKNIHVLLLVASVYFATSPPLTRRPRNLLQFLFPQIPIVLFFSLWTFVCRMDGRFEL
jgi:hypothetical protein